MNTIIIGVDSKNLPILLDMYKAIPGVAQVRCNYVLRKFFKKMFGEDGLYICCYVPSKGFDDRFVKFEECLAKTAWDDVEAYDELVNNMKTKIDNYLLNGILPNQMAE